MGGRVGRRNVTPRRSSFRTVALLMLLPIGALLLFLGYRFARDVVHQPVIEESAIPRPPQKKRASQRGDIVLILDDVGFDHQPLAGAMTIDPKVNFSVLPNSRNATLFANELSARGFEVLCHLPMEPDGFPRISPGPGAVLTTMSDGEIAAATRANVAAVPHARGVNNHMGSRATADPRVMSAVLNALPHGMYFIDSRTTAASVGEALARQMNIRTAARNVFLDDVQTEAAIRAQLHELERDAAARGVAVGIGHMYPATIKVLAEEARQLRASGYRFRRASEIVN
ncbi:MAG TPA: divergent polysaccharide deacetylase family protein [Thermoanaerobaculia bacterium]|nr:divergent polysaccharide deacetylase family protein [Thermoanaerobaculia bacterium]